VGRNSVTAPPLSPASFRAPANREETDVIGIIEGKIITEHSARDDPDRGWRQAPRPARDLLRIAVIERHGKNGNIATGFVRGFGMQAGAIASTVSHDHHNIACVGVDYATWPWPRTGWGRSRAASSWPAMVRFWPNWPCPWRG
jgi:adenine deaminase